MRTLALPLLALAVVLGFVVANVQARAEGDAPDADAKVKILELQVKALKADSELLYSREATMTKYLLTLSTTMANLRQGLDNARTLGFEAAAIPANSRIALLATLDHLAKDIANALPAPTAEQQEMARRADQLRKEAFSR